METKTTWTMSSVARSEALELIDEMIRHIKWVNADAIPALRGKDKCIGSTSYYWPRLEYLRNALERG
jgi:hypothetical protein